MFKFEVIDLARKNFVPINSKYFNDNFNALIYMSCNKTFRVHLVEEFE